MAAASPLTPMRVSGSGACSGACCTLLMARLVPADTGLCEGRPFPAQPSRGVGRPGPAAATRGFCSPALLVHLAVGFPPLPLRPAAWKQGGKESSDRWTRQAGEDVRREGQDPCSIAFCQKRCLPLFFPTLSPKASVRLGRAEGGESGKFSGSRRGQGKAKGGEP